MSEIDEVSVNEKEIKQEIDDIDYAILRLINYINTLNLNDIEKEIREITSILQIRVIIVEKHIYRLSKNGFIKFDERCILTQKGEDAINKFERDNKEYMSIDNFIIASIKNKKERDLKIHKIVDKVLLIIIVMLIILVIYVAIIY